MKNDLFLSIIIPVYNSEKTVGKCLDSVYNSDYPKTKYEVIVVDDGSTDDSISIIKKYKRRLIKLKNNKGAANARNIGAKLSKGKILFFIDSDIILSPNSLKIIDTIFKKNLKVSIVNGIYSKKPYDNRLFTLYKSLNHYYYEIRGVEHKLNFLQPFCGAIIKEKFINIGGFDGNIKGAGGEEEEFSSRIPDSYQTLWIPEIEAVHFYPGFLKSIIKYAKRGNIYSFNVLKYKTFRKTHPLIFLDEITGYISAVFTLPVFLSIFIFSTLLLKVILLFLILVFIVSKINFYFLLLKERKKYLFPIFIIINYIETLCKGIGITLGIARYVLKSIKDEY